MSGPAITSPVRTYLEREGFELIEKRFISQRDVAQRFDVSKQHISALVTMDRARRKFGAIEASGQALDRERRIADTSLPLRARKVLADFVAYKARLSIDPEAATIGQALEHWPMTMADLLRLPRCGLLTATQLHDFLTKAAKHASSRQPETHR